MNHLLQITAVLSAASLAAAGSLNLRGGFELLILHNNDMHARFEQTSQLSGICTAEDEAMNKCYGGFARVATVVKEARRKAKTGEGPPVLYLNAGDTYTGSAWFTIYKWKIAAEFINALQPDAVALGNNDIIAGSNVLSPFVHELQSPVVASNVILKSEKDDDAVIQKSIVFDVEGKKVGVVGYLKLDKNTLDSSGNNEYIDEIMALKEEVAKLQEHDVNIIIALGHADLDTDIEIAREVEGIDIVVGGTKNVYFWNGTVVTKTDDKAIVVNRPSGSSALVLQSHAYNEYLGGLHVEFDADGEMKSFSDQPISLNSAISRDPITSKLLETFTDELNAEVVIGTTAVVLDGNSCKIKECNLGNMITDAMILYRASRYEGSTWTDASAAVLPSDMISGSIAPISRPGDVTEKDLLSVLPLESKIFKVTMDGTVLLQILEHAVSAFDISNPTGQLLQMSGIRLTYDLDKEVGSRVVSVVVRCWSCVVPIYYEIENERTYTLLMPESLASGGYGYTMIPSLPKQELEYDEITSVIEFMKFRTPVYPEEAGRIEIINLKTEEDSEGENESEGESGGEDVGESGNDDSGVNEDAGEDGPNSGSTLGITLIFMSILPFLLQ